MILQLSREQYKRGRFRYAVQSSGISGLISFEKMNEGNIVVCSDGLSNSFELNVYPFFRTKEKNGEEIKQLAGDYMLESDGRGSIYYCGKKGSNFLNGIYYWTFEEKGQRNTAYEVGFGRKGIYLCIWIDGAIKAIVSKNTHTKRFESEYEIFVENESNAGIAIISAVFWDLTRYYPSGSAEEFHALNTWQKELKNKFDPNFIEHVISLEK